MNLLHRIAVLALTLPAGVALAAPATTADEAVPRGALSRAVVPERYALTLTVDPRQPGFEGRVEIAVRIVEPTRRIFLHGLGLAVREATLRTATRSVPLDYAEIDGTLGVARLEAADTVPAGAATLVIDWSAAYQQGEGLYKVAAGEDAYVFTQMQPISARRAFPGFDDPQFKTPFEVTVVAPAADRVIANAPLAASEPAGDGRVRHRFAPTPPLPTYLFAVAVGPLDVVAGAAIPARTAKRPPLPLRGVATRGQGPRLAYALETTDDVLLALEDWFGIPFPYAKLDLIASPGMPGAMENAGAIVYGDAFLLLGADAPPSQLRGYYEIHAHEIAHHWFGNLVTPRWWDDIWLNESFATWMAVKIARRVRPDLTPATAITQEALSAMTVDARAAGRPMRQPVPENAGIASTFDEITYQKGGGVLSMVESYLGPEAFRRGVQAHLAKHPHGTATADDFFAAMATAAKQPEIVEAFRSFVTQPGFPLVEARRAPTGDLELAQSRYAPVGSRIRQGQPWKIPLCASFYGERGAARRCTLLGGAAATLAVPPEVGRVLAVLPNADGAGYYRFALGKADLAALLARAETLPDGEALVLADSVYGAFSAGRASLAAMLDAAAALATHRDRVTATTLGFELMGIGERMLEPGQRGALRARLAAIYGPRLAAVGATLDVAGNAADGADVRLLRRGLVTLVALGAREPELRARLVEAATAALEDPSALDIGLRDRAWAVAVQEGVAPVVAAVEAALVGQDPLGRRHAAFALGRGSEAIAAGTRERLLDPAVPAPDAVSILALQFGQPETRDGAWAWLQANAGPLAARLPEFGRSWLIGLPSEFCSDGARREAAAFGERMVREAGSGQLELDRALESIELCAALKAHHAKEFAALGAR